MKLERILVPIDYSEGAASALRAALGLRARLGGRITVLHVVEPLDAVPFAPVVEIDYHPEGWQKAARTELEAFVKRVCPRVGDFETDACHGRVADRVLERAQKLPADLIVMGTHGRTGLGRLLLGSVAEEVIRTATRPVLTVREDAAAPASEPVEEKDCFAVRKVLIPTDFSDAAREGVRLGGAMAGACGAEVHLLHVIDRRSSEASSPLGKRDQRTVDELYANALGEARAAVAAERTHAGGDAPIHEHVLLGYPAQDIARVAEEMGADLVVMGSRGRSGLAKRIIGSTAERVVRLAPCPVMTLRSIG